MSNEQSSHVGNTPTAEKGGHRDVKATLTSEEFGACQWAAKHAGKMFDYQGAALPLADFFRLSLLVSVKGVVENEIARGKSVPPDIAHLISSVELKSLGRDKHCSPQ
jgi:hypothetical protein